MTVHYIIIATLLMLLACSIAVNLWLLKVLDDINAESEFEWAEEVSDGE